MYNILICDDEKDIVNALKIYLTDENYSTFTAYNGKQALDIIHTNEIHLVLMDIMMPQMDGIQTLSAIRQEYNIPVILLSQLSSSIRAISSSCVVSSGSSKLFDSIPIYSQAFFLLFT